MKNKLAQCCCAIIIFIFVAGAAFPLLASGPTNYTYTYNEWGVPVPSPDAYRVTAFILGEDLGVGHFLNPRDISVFENYIYVADTGNNRVVVIRINEDGTHEAVEAVYQVYVNGNATTFDRPFGIFVSEWPNTYGEIWIADTHNNRILHTDSNWNVITEIETPTELSLIDEDMNEFLPEKISVDFSGTVFVQARHINRGLMEFARSGVFSGYMGAPPVNVSPIERFWRMVATREQRERRIQMVPVEYNNVSIDHEGFLFVTTSSTGVDPVRRLNMLGNDVMIRNGFTDPVGDLWFGDAAQRIGPSVFIDITALPNNTFVAFDRTRGRLFKYCSQGHLLYVWGGPGFREGFFELPAALDNKGYTLFALDAATAAITRFDLTEYGTLINQGLALYPRGLYEESAAAWQEVLRMNGNFGLAYVGIARAHLRQENYREAMRYFRVQNDQANFGRAFGFYRRQWVEENFWIFGIGIGLLLLVPPVVKKVIAIRKELSEL
jgi:hypothetical protein